jgi:hypothetical protein
LKKVVGDQVPVAALSPYDLTLQVPQAVLQRRVINQGHRTVVQGLVCWSQSSDAMAMWEDLVALKQRFPVAPAWGQLDSNGGGVVSTDASGGAAATGSWEAKFDQMGRR